MVIIATRDSNHAISCLVWTSRPSSLSSFPPHNPQNLIRMVKAVVLGAAGQSCFCRSPSYHLTRIVRRYWSTFGSPLEGEPPCH
jgi:hypothetical protein